MKNCKKKRCKVRGCISRDIPGTADWMERIVAEGNAVALIFARTETGIFFPHVWDRADAVFFFDGRLTFYNVDGTPADGGAGAPSCLVAYGEENAKAIRACERGITMKMLTPQGKLKEVTRGGKFVDLRR